MYSGVVVQPVILALWKAEAGMLKALVYLGNSARLFQNKGGLEIFKS